MKKLLLITTLVATAITGASAQTVYKTIDSTEMTGGFVNVYDLPFGFTAHWILYNSSAYDKMIEWKNIKGPEIDVYIYQHFRVKVILPFLAGQAEGYSNIERKILNYNHLFAKAEKKFQLPYKLSVSSLSALIRSGSTRVTTPKFMTR